MTGERKIGQVPEFRCWRCDEILWEPAKAPAQEQGWLAAFVRPLFLYSSIGRDGEMTEKIICVSCHNILHMGGK